MIDIKLHISAILAALAVPLAMRGQENGLWDLRRCIDHAVENNLTVKSSELSREQNELDLNTAKASRLPDLSAGAGQNFSFGRGLSESNTYVNTNTSSTSFSLGSSVNIFSGMRVNKTIKLNALNLEAATADLEKAKDDIRVQVTQQYVQILYDQEIVKVAERQVSIDSVQVARLRAMLENGKASAAEVAQQEASLGQSRLTLTQARNTLALSLLDLSQLLELPSPQGFGIVTPEVGITLPMPACGPEEIYAEAVGRRPGIKAEQLRLDAADMNIGIAKSAYYPTLTLNGGIGSNAYKSSGYDAAKFWDQFKNNFSQYVGLSLNIPIFAKLSTRNSVRGARLSRSMQLVQLESAKKSLYKEIQQAWYNAVAAESKLSSCQDALTSAEKSFELVSAKYESGKASATEFAESRNSLMKAQSDLVQARYEHLFQVKLLDFYRGSDLAL
ncbi:MAG: TolC family protein [Bacteroidales bacterium]|nr:TolC family protein [Bacteroidales bacterium]